VWGGGTWRAAELLHEVAVACHGWTPADLQNLLRELALFRLRNPTADTGGTVVQALVESCSSTPRRLLQRYGLLSPCRVPLSDFVGGSSADRRRQAKDRAER
jgi:hypothetical protein